MEKRVQFDFEIEFTNGGRLHGQEFRLDIAGDGIEDEELANYLVHDMRLLMVGKITIHNKTILDEAHKRSPLELSSDREKQLVDLILEHVLSASLQCCRSLPCPCCPFCPLGTQWSENEAPEIMF